ncbi:MAG: DUF2730 domain-containing protein [Fimbriimonadaceae bacterium]|nr:DUF2730 domain-containing protein [Fimbriimonadaceae bacterium]
MNRGFGWFFFGLLSGVVGTLAWQRFRERYEESQGVDCISEGIERRLDQMEAVLD